MSAKTSAGGASLRGPPLHEIAVEAYGPARRGQVVVIFLVVRPRVVGNALQSIVGRVEDELYDELLRAKHLEQIRAARVRREVPRFEFAHQRIER